MTDALLRSALPGSIGFHGFRRRRPAALSSGAPLPRTLTKKQYAALTVGALGVVFGDIGTSPLYAFREALGQAGAIGRAEVLGVLSLAFWALMLIVTIKYVFFLMRADNDGEGGVLSLMALAQKAMSRRSAALLALGAVGAALFYGDSMITPAISVLSAVEGLKTLPGIGTHIDLATVLMVSVGILVALFALQAKGTERVARLFGPVCIVWFVAIGVLGLTHIKDAPSVLQALNPLWGIQFVAGHGMVGLLALGAVFLTVTGAEALTADMGHFGRGPIQLGWLSLVFPALTLNYFGQGALALNALGHASAAHPFQNADWFFLMAPGWFRAPLVILATAATVIASQAVITGAFSLTQQAIQLGLLPRMDIRRTSSEQAGQIYIGRINGLLLVGVLLMALSFHTSSALAHAYGIAVTGTMVITTLLAFLVARNVWQWPVWAASLAIAPFLLLDVTFFGANALRILSGGWVPLALGGGLLLVMWTWVRGARLLTAKVARQSLTVKAFLHSLNPNSVYRAAGTAVFLTSDPDVAPIALMHNLKHNRVLHAQNIVATVVSTDSPHVPPQDRLSVTWIAPDFARVVINYGYMEAPDVPKAMAEGQARGLKLEPMNTSYFLSRRSLVRSQSSEMPLWQDRLFIFLSKNATDPTTYFHIPAGRVVEMGAQVAV